MSGTTLDTVSALFAEHLGVPVESVKPESTVASLFGDSLDEAELVIGIEDKFGIQITDDDARTLDSVGKVAEYIDGRKQAERV